ncbi:MAG: hypothetical protein CVV28_05145 [Methanobacteriales archaeon HGW-Methanobacteriales-1]|jgi:hypothetical protein|nr:MAG: hypothetical protein CVV28_05145 [Methanobacteriales archaeon HGW-Methanobacteriales-1]
MFTVIRLPFNGNISQVLYDINYKLNTMTGYSAEEKSKLLIEFESFNKGIKQFIGKKFGDDFAKTAAFQIKKEYNSLLEDMPYIGGSDNPLTITITSTTQYLAVYLVLKRRGKDLKDIGEICYRHADDFFKNNSDEIMPMDNPQVIGFLKYMASESENRIYHGDFVFEFVEGEDFDFGLDFKECAICKFFQEKGADEFVPYMCAMDIPESKYGCLGLKRTMTLAEGADKCDFRYKKGAPTEIVSAVINEEDF